MNTELLVYNFIQINIRMLAYITLLILVYNFNQTNNFMDKLYFWSLKFGVILILVLQFFFFFFFLESWSFKIKMLWFGP